MLFLPSNSGAAARVVTLTSDKPEGVTIMGSQTGNTRSFRLAIGALAVSSLIIVTGWLGTTTVFAKEHAARTMAGEWILGVAPGEALRVIGVSNPWARRTDGATMRFRVIGSDGTTLYESDPMRIAHGSMGFTDVPRHEIAARGDPVNGRLQARVVFYVELRPGSGKADFTPMAEIFDLATGSTRQRTGPIIDVLYSAAGNSADGIY
jgi:hypothetical protein